MKTRFLQRGAVLCALSILTVIFVPGVSLAEAGEAPAIHLRYASFDPLQGEPEMALALVSPVAVESAGAYLLQFVGPVREEWKAAVRQAGVTLYGYVPDYAFLARGEAAALARARALPFVRWVGPYHPAYRLAPDLAAESLEAGGVQSLAVQTLPDADLEALAAQVIAWGGQVEARFAGEMSGYLKVDLPAARLGDLAALDGVTWIEPSLPQKLFNDVGGGTIMKASTVRASLGLYGSGQVVAVADTGLDVGTTGAAMSDDFEGRIVDGRSLCDPAMRTTWDDLNGHGTHVAGSVLGSGVLSGSAPASHQYANSFAGVAPEARLVFQSIDAQTYSYLECIPADFVNQLFKPAYDLGARLHSNSWGGPTGGTVFNPQYGGYTSNSRMADEAIWIYRKLFVLYAAGNEGVDANVDGLVDPDSIGSPATAKNVLTVGASESNRPDIYDYWGVQWPDDYPANPIFSDQMANNPNGMAAFSSRGPTDDGRIKPDVVAPGTYIVSARSHAPEAGTGWGVYPSNSHYLYMGGTSMATPLTAGAAALAREWLIRYEGVSDPSAALVKAVLINGAADMSPGQYAAPQEVPSQRPNPVSGWGRVDLQGSLNPASPTQIWVRDEAAGLHTGEQATFELAVGAAAEQAQAAPEPGSSATTPEPPPAFGLAPIAPQEEAFQPTLAGQALGNPGFETGDWSPWLVETTTGSKPALDNAIWRSGAWSARLGHDLGLFTKDYESVYQPVNVPADTSSISVDFWYRLQTDESTAGVDGLCFGMWYSDGSVAWDNCFADFAVMGDRDWSQNVYTLEASELAAVAGRSVFFGFQTQNDFSSLSQAWVDDAALNVTTGAPAITPSPSPSPSPSGSSLRVTLAWSDYPGEPTAAVALVNDLHLEVIDPNGTHYYGNSGVYTTGTCLKDGKWDGCNNVEGVIIPSAPYGTYTIVVHGANVAQGPQTYALVAAGDYLDHGAESGQGAYLPLVMRRP